jgi:flavin-binding protein dodecin
MSIVKIIEVSSESSNSFDEAAKNAYTEAAKTIKNIKHVYVKDFEIVVGDNGQMTYRTNCKVSFQVNSSQGM